MKLYVVFSSYDWNEELRTVNTLEDLEKILREDFDVPEEIAFGTIEFRFHCVRAYQEDDWQAHTVAEVDLVAGTAKRWEGAI